MVFTRGGLLMEVLLHGVAARIPGDHVYHAAIAPHRRGSAQTAERLWKMRGRSRRNNMKGG